MAWVALVRRAPYFDGCTWARAVARHLPYCYCYFDPAPNLRVLEVEDPRLSWRAPNYCLARFVQQASLFQLLLVDFENYRRPVMLLQFVQRQHRNYEFPWRTKNLLHM